MKIGRNNFSPPPAVESSVVRLVPKRPRPQVSWEEWDGLLRVCFVRKNRMLRAGFLGTSPVMEMLEANYRTFCAQKNINVEDGPAESLSEATIAMDNQIPALQEDNLDNGGAEEEEEEEQEEWAGIMDIDDDDIDIPPFFKEESNERAKQINSRANSKRRRKGKVAELVRAKVEKVLEETELADRRARMCDEGDFLKLLWAFNREGIHFS